MLSNPELVAWLLLRMDAYRNRSMELALADGPLTMPQALELAELKGRYAEAQELHGRLSAGG